MLDCKHSKTQVFLALLALPLIAGFDLAETDRHPKAAMGTPSQAITRTGEPDMDFHRSLATAYFNLAAQSANSIQDQQIFVQKALSARNGQTPEPAHLEEWVLSDEQRVILSEARAHLINHLAMNSDTASKTAALTSFDCWVARAEQAVFVADHQHCRQTFEYAVGLAPRDHENAHNTAHRPEEANKTSS